MSEDLEALRAAWRQLSDAFVDEIWRLRVWITLLWLAVVAGWATSWLFAGMP